MSTARVDGTKYNPSLHRPCNTCDKFEDCKKYRLACHAFKAWSHAGTVNRYRREPNRSIFNKIYEE